MFQLLPEPFGQDARDILARMLGNKQLKSNLVRSIIKGSSRDHQGIIKGSSGDHQGIIRGSGLIQCSGSILFRCGCGSGSASAFKKWIRIQVIDISSLRFFSIFAYFYDTIFNICSFSTVQIWGLKAKSLFFTVFI